MKQSLKNTVLSTYDKNLRPTDGGVADVFTLSVDFTSISSVKFAERTFEASGVYPAVLSFSLCLVSTSHLPPTGSNSASHCLYRSPAIALYCSFYLPLHPPLHLVCLSSLAHMMRGYILDRLDTHDLERRACSVECSNLQPLPGFHGLGRKRG